jgi:hypothetical protein
MAYNRQEWSESLRVILYESSKNDELIKIRRMAEEAGYTGKRAQDYIIDSIQNLNISFNTNNNARQNTIEVIERIGDIHPRYLKFSPKEWILKLRESEWFKKGMDGIKYRVEEVQDTINGEDALDRSPAMIDCTWQELYDAKRHGFLIVMIKAYNLYNEKIINNPRYEYLKR